MFSFASWLRTLTSNMWAGRIFARPHQRSELQLSWSSPDFDEVLSPLTLPAEFALHSPSHPKFGRVFRSVFCLFSGRMAAEISKPTEHFGGLEAKVAQFMSVLRPFGTFVPSVSPLFSSSLFCFFLIKDISKAECFWWISLSFWSLNMQEFVPELKQPSSCLRVQSLKFPVILSLFAG